MSWTNAIPAGIADCTPFVASAQWDGEKRVQPCSGQSVETLRKGINGSKYDRANRVALEEAFDRDDQFLACCLNRGRLVNSIKRSADRFTQHSNPCCSSSMPALSSGLRRGTCSARLACADREYEAAQSCFEEYLRFPPASEDVLGKRRDRYVEEVKESSRPLPLNWPFARRGKYCGIHSPREYIPR